VVGWGSTYGHLKTAVLDLNEQGKKVALAHFNYINPLPKNTAEVIAKYKKVVVCELNGGQFATILRTKVPGKEYLQYNKVQGQPFSSAELEEHISSLLK
jgi:2-oxoglutarate ferredoxin oxidoreductase subunit alpha